MPSSIPKEQESSSSSSSSMMMLQSGTMQAHAIRFKPKTDLVSAILNTAKEAMKKSQSSSACILSVVGSLDYVKLRMANACRKINNETKNDDDGDTNDGTTTTTNNEMKEWKNERFEIVSLVGTIGHQNGEKHLHMSVSNANGQVFGGHVIAGRVFTTLELVLGTIQNVTFKREIDPDTGYKELVVVSSQTTTKTNDDNDDDGNDDNNNNNTAGIINHPNKKSKIS